MFPSKNEKLAHFRDVGTWARDLANSYEFT